VNFKNQEFVMKNIKVELGILLFVTTYTIAADVQSLDNINTKFTVHEHGYWQGDDVRHTFDEKLASAIASFFKFEKARSIVDFGCGDGHYVKFFIEKKLLVDGFDGNPAVNKITNGLCNVLDLSVPFDLNRTYDWVLSLEVGEHIPKKSERIFIDNLIRHTHKGIILSWAIKGQGGVGHFNEQDNDYIKTIFEKAGFVNDLQIEAFLRKESSVRHFKNTVMVFRKNFY
jgi:cyclopropane fatty-acyl-phospholipid synthase-like methyltransferase